MGQRRTNHAMTQDQRRRFRAWRKECERMAAAWRESELGRLGVPPPAPPIPSDLYGLSCGARTRKGAPCRRPAVKDVYGLPRNGRCRFHGGLSTGPRTAQGKACVAQNGLRPKKAAV